MHRVRNALPLILVLPALAACQSSTTTSDAGDWPEPRASSEFLDQSVMNRLAALEGEWELKQEDGSWGKGSTFTVTSNGSAVREIMFPGEPHEMTNLYHMDGEDIVATHYCAVGNQPRLVATGFEQAEGGASLPFEFQSVSNFRESHDHVMGGLTLVFLDADTIHEIWTSFDSEGAFAHEMTFEFRRKK